jgi:heme/copper-type cytochrome/quinol oxidase subunit 3
MAATFNAWRARSLPLPRARRALQFATVLAAVFVANKSLEYRSEWTHGIVPAVSTFVAIYYTLTAFHALHVIGGVVANGWALAGRAGDAMTSQRIRLLSWYWAFVDAIWLIIFALVYVS